MANANVTILLRARDLASRTLTRLGTGFDGLKAKALGLQGALAGLGVALSGAAVIGYLTSVNREYGKLLTQLQTFQGSADGAKAVFADLAQFAAKTPFQIGELVEGFIKLRSAGITPTMETMRLFGDHAAAFGGRFQDFADAIRAATTGEMERMKQFGLVMRLEGQEITASFNGTKTVIGRDAQSIVTYLEELSRKNFSGGMERQSKTLDGAISNLKDAFESLARKIGDAGFTDAVIKMTLKLTAWTSAITDNDGAIRKWIGLIGDTANVMKTSFGVIGAWIDVVAAKWEHFKLITTSDNLLRDWEKIGAAWNKIGTAQAALTAAQGRRAGAMGDRRHNAAINAMGSPAQQRRRAIEAKIANDQALTPDEMAFMMSQGAVEGGLAKTGGAVASGDKTGKASTKKTKTRQELLVERVTGAADMATQSAELKLGTYGKRLGEMVAAEAALAEAIARGNLSREQMLDLEERRQQLVEDRKKLGLLTLEERAGAAVDASVKAGRQRDADARQAEIDASIRGTFGEKGTFNIDTATGSNKILGGISRAMKNAIGEAQTLNQIIADMTTSTFQAFGGAVEDAFRALADGSASAGQAFASAMLGALASIASGFGQFFMARATGELAAGIGALSNPLTAPKAAGHFASAAKWTAGAFAMFALAGTMSGVASRASGGGGSRAGANNANKTLADQDKGAAEIIIEGGFLDMNDPRTEASFARAMESLTGRRVTVRSRRG